MPDFFGCGQCYRIFPFNRYMFFLLEFDYGSLHYFIQKQKRVIILFVMLIIRIKIYIFVAVKRISRNDI